MVDKDDRAASLRAQLLETTGSLPTSRFSRFFRAGRAAAGLASATLGGRLRGRGDGLAAADLDDIARLVTRLGELKGVAMKAGQILGYVDPTMPDELRQLLSILHTTAVASPFSTVEATVRAAFGARAEVLLAAMDRAPIAVASIGQVHRAQVGDTELAIKVRHPGIEQAFESDFNAASIGAVFARSMAPTAGATARSCIDEARTAMLEECDFALEAERQAMFAEWYEDHPTIRIPRVERGWCAPTVLATRWVPGSSLDAWLASDPPQVARDRVGIALFEFYVGTLYQRGAFHADPHPGNYAFLEDGRIAVYDFGCVRSFDGATVAALARLVAATRADDGAGIEEAFVALGASPPRGDVGRAQLRALLREFFAPLLVTGRHRVEPGAGIDARELLRDKRALMTLSLPAKLLFLFRIRFGLYAVLARIGAVADWGALESTWASRSAPARLDAGVAHS